MNEKRPQLASFSTIEHVIEKIRSSRKMLLITGAGISVSCGIPDFRSKISGLYHTLDCEKIDIPSPELLFDFDFFTIDPLPFYKFAEMLIPNDHIQPSKSHQFIKLLETKKKLLRNYTQNVDGLERKAGIKKVFECHGNMKTFNCLSCKKKSSYLDAIPYIQQQRVFPCKKCRSPMKPNIVFFGQNLSKTFSIQLQHDLLQCDLILIMGTSLKVHGAVYEILQQMDHSIPQIVINKDIIEPFHNISNGFDVILLGHCDEIIQYICERIDNWDEELLKCPDKIWMDMTPSPSSPSSPLNNSPKKRKLNFISTSKIFHYKHLLETDRIFRIVEN